MSRIRVLTRLFSAVPYVKSDGDEESTFAGGDAGESWFERNLTTDRTPEDDVADAERSAFVRSLLMTLPMRERYILVRRMQGETLDSIARSFQRELSRERRGNWR